MRRPRTLLLIIGAVLLTAMPSQAQSFPLDTTDGLTVYGAEVSVVEYRGRRALRAVEMEQGVADTIIVIDGLEFENGTIELELAGAPRTDARPGMRGFVGVAFRVEEGPPHQYECIYLRPTNGRAVEQIRRNHSTQYVSHPEYPWHRLRKESPGVYESYVDLEPGSWTKVRIDVSGTKAKLFVHGVDQPTLIVSDLKRGASRGKIALWIAEGTEAHFRNLKVTTSN